MDKKLSLNVVFDFNKNVCLITDNDRNIIDAYQCFEPGNGVIEDIATDPDFNKFIGDCVSTFLDDNQYDFSENEEEEDNQQGDD